MRGRVEEGTGRHRDPVPVEQALELEPEPETTKS